MTNLTLANAIENNLGPGAEMFQEVAVKLHFLCIGSKHGRKAPYIVSYWR